MYFVFIIKVSYCYYIRKFTTFCRLVRIKILRPDRNLTFSGSPLHSESIGLRVLGLRNDEGGFTSALPEISLVYVLKLNMY